MMNNFFIEEKIRSYYQHAHSIKASFGVVPGALLEDH